MTKAQKQHYLQKYREIASAVKVCMLMTQPAGKTLQARPMNTVHVEDNGTLWFFTNEFSRKVKEISRNHEVHLTYAGTGRNSYLFVAGTATLVEDANRMKEFFTSDMETWFPEGLKDPKLMLLKVMPHDAEYWDGSSSKMVALIKMLRSALKKEEYVDGEHARIHLN